MSRDSFSGHNYWGVWPLPPSRKQRPEMLLNNLQSTGKQHTLCNKDLSTQNANGAKVGEPDPE